MNLLHPWAMFIGALALAMPFVIHWLTRPKPMRMPLSTVRFVKQLVEQRRARYRLRDWLVLLLRTAAIILIAWAFARPLSSDKPIISTTESGNAIRVVVLDVSQSMGALSGSTSSIDRGRVAAANYLSFQPNLRAGLIFAGARPSAIFEQPSSNLRAMRDALSNVSAQPQRLDAQASINRAAEMFAATKSSDDQKLELVIVSDFQRNNWASADFSPLPKDTKIQFESTAPTQSPGNLSIVRVGTSGRLEQGREAKLDVEIGNYSKTPRDVAVEVTLNDAPLQLRGLCPPGVKTTLSANLPLTTAGWMTGKARLLGSNDALAGDDERYFAIGVHTAPVYALITRESSSPYISSSHFLERALVPHRMREGESIGERVARLDPSKPDIEALNTAAIIVLDHPGKLSPETINILAGLMRRGRGVFYLASESIDATNLKLLSDAAGTDMKMPVEFQPAAANTDRRDLFLVEWRKDQAPFVSLGEGANALLSPLRFAGGLASQRAEGGLNDDVLATYSDRSASLVMTTCGAGAIAILNADLMRSSFVSSAAFVPVVSEITGRLLASHGIPDAAACGEAFTAYLPPDAGAPTGLVVSLDNTSPDESGSFNDSNGAVLWHWNAAGKPGVYQVKRDKSVVFAAATGAPGIEGDLQTIDPKVLQTKLAGGRATYFQSAGAMPPKDDTWAWLLTICAGCMISELFVLKAFKT